MQVHIYRENLHHCQDPLFLWSIITRNESWFSVLEPEPKQQSCQWTEKGVRPKKALHSRQARKSLMEVFFDDQGVVHLEFLPPKMTVTSNVYVGILARLREAIQRKRPVLWSDKSFRILHDNALGHKAAHTVTAMLETGMMEVAHTPPPYSLDLALADFWFFPYLKAKIRGCIFRNISELQDELVRIISQMPKSFFHEALHVQLPNRWRKCIASHGEYFEGDNVVLPPRDSQLLEDTSSESATDSD